MTDDELEAFFLNHDSPLFERIQDADTEEEAIYTAEQALIDDEADIWYDDEALDRVVKKIRGS